MARLKIAYIGAGGTRGVGTNAAFIHQHKNSFAGSEIALMDTDGSRFPIIKKLADKMAAEEGADFKFTCTTSIEEAVADADAVLTSFRPGGFEARHFDESIPAKYGCIGNETQGAGGFFMALRSINALKPIVKAIKKRAKPGCILFNYTNPVNVVSQALTMFTDVPVYSFCEGPIVFPGAFCWWHEKDFGLDHKQLDATMIGLNHGGWTVRHRYDGQDFMPILADIYEARKRRGDPDSDLRLFRLALMMDSIPAHYYDKYFYTDEMLAEQSAKTTTRAQDILASVPDYWEHYIEQANTKAKSVLDPNRSRGGITEFELAIDAIDNVFNNRNVVMPVNMLNNGNIPELQDDLVVEVPALVNRNGFHALTRSAAERSLPAPTRGIVHALGEYQYLTAQAALTGNRTAGIQALMSNPLVRTLDKAEKMYDEMARAHRRYLPRRLLKD
jgi:6-phospho-beta-glucosidase